MSGNSVLVSYVRRHRADIEDLVAYLGDVGLNVWYDREIRTGDFRDWISNAILNSRAMVAFIHSP